MLHVSGRDASEHTAAAALTELRNNNNHHMKNKSIASPNAIVTSILSKNHIDHLEANSVSVIPIDAADNGKQNNGSIISGGLPNTQQQSRIKGKNIFALHSNICVRAGAFVCPFSYKHIIAAFRFFFVGFVSYVNRDLMIFCLYLFHLVCRPFFSLCSMLSTTTTTKCSEKITWTDKCSSYLEFNESYACNNATRSSNRIGNASPNPITTALRNGCRINGHQQKGNHLTAQLESTIAGSWRPAKCENDNQTLKRRRY